MRARLIGAGLLHLQAHTVNLKAQVGPCRHALDMHACVSALLNCIRPLGSPALVVIIPEAPCDLHSSLITWPLITLPLPPEMNRRAGVTEF